ncbi:MAG: aromatic ring-hydroxylating dioxygenase subunit alpha [Candidatus Tectomicrobia bacterium]
MHEGDLWPALRRYWHPVAFSEDVGQKPLAVRLLDEQVVVCRLRGDVKAFRDLCIHRGTALSLGWVEGDTLVCAYHGWAYRGDGQCVRIPSIPPEHPIPKKACLTTYLAEERYGLVWVCMSAEPLAPIPDYPEFEDPSYGVFIKQWKPWNCSAAREIENFVDQAHFAWIHEGILGDREHPLAPEMHLEREADNLHFWFRNEPTNLHTLQHCRRYRLTRPFTIHNRNERSADDTEIFFVAVTPHSAKASTRFMVLARNYNLDASEVVEGPILWRDDEIAAPPLNDSAQAMLDLMETVYKQDFVVVETQRPEELPLDLSEELHLKGPDSVAVAYRRMMREIGVD